MNFRTTGLLLLCVLVAGGLFWWSQTSATAPGVRLDAPPLVPGKLLGMRVVFASREFEIKREGDGWSQTAPSYAPLNADAGRAWTDAVAALRPLEEVQPGIGDTPGLASLALAPPVATVTVITADGAVELALGDQTLDDSGYLRLDDGRVFLVPDDLHNLVYGPPPTQSFADALPLPPLAALDRVTFTRGRDTVQLYRQPGGWSLLPDGLRRVRPEVIDALALLTDRTPILRHQDQDKDPARYGLNPPRATLTFAGPDRPVFQLDLGRSAAVEQGAMFARVSRDSTPGPIVAVPIERAKIAFAPLDQFRDPRLFDAAADDVTELSLRIAGRPPITLRDSGAGLEYVGDARLDAEPAELLDAVLGLRSTGTLPMYLAAADDAPPAIALDLRFGVTGATSLNIYRSEAGWVALRGDEPEPTNVTDATIAALLGLFPS